MRKPVERETPYIGAVTRQEIVLAFRCGQCLLEDVAAVARAHVSKRALSQDVSASFSLPLSFLELPT